MNSRSNGMSFKFSPHFLLSISILLKKNPILNIKFWIVMNYVKFSKVIMCSYSVKLLLFSYVSNFLFSNIAKLILFSCNLKLVIQLRK